MKETMMNKIYSIILLLLGVISMKTTGDCTVFVMMSMISVWLFTQKEDVIE